MPQRPPSELQKLAREYERLTAAIIRCARWETRLSVLTQFGILTSFMAIVGGLYAALPWNYAAFICCGHSIVIGSLMLVNGRRHKLIMRKREVAASADVEVTIA